MKKKDKSQKNSFRSIAQTLSLRMGLIILIIMAIFIASAVMFSGRIIEHSIEQNLKNIAQKNAVKVQAVTDAAQVAADTVVSGAYKYSVEEVPGDASEPSVVNPSVKLTYWQKEEEDFLQTTLMSFMISHPEYEGMAVYFKDGKFQPNFRGEYGFYMAQQGDDYVSFPFSVKAGEASEESLTTLNQGTVEYSNPHVSDYTESTLVTGTFPLNVNGEVIGIVSIDMNVEAFAGTQVGNDDYSSMLVDVIMPSHKMAYSTFKTDIGKGFADFLGKDAENEIVGMMAGGTQFSMQTNSGGYHKVRSFTPVSVGDSTWWTQTSISFEEYSQAMKMTLIVLVTLAVIAIIVLYVFSNGLFKKTLAPLPDAAKMAELVAVGNFNEIGELTKTGVYDHNDEIGLLMKSLGQMTTRMENIMSDIKDKLGKMGDGDFAFKNDQTDIYVGAYADILTNLDSIEGKLNNTISEIKMSSEMINTSASQVSAGAQALAQGSTEQASSIEELSTTMTGITSKIQETNAKTEEAAQIGRSANEAVQLSNEKMEKLSDAMKDITNKADEIAKIITTIDDIAFQTNILALNASIEAARAGQAGKGFAVVADEVGNLASKSAKSAQSIAGLIQETIEAVNNGAELTTDTANALKEVEENTVKIGTLMGEIADASTEQAKNVADVSTGIDQISAVVQTNSATAEESAAASQQLSDEADSMFGLVQGFVLKSEETEELV